MSVLVEIKKNIFLQPITISVPMKIYLDQSLYCEYVNDTETLVISFNQMDHKIYIYYRSKESPAFFLDFIRDLGFIKHKHFLLYEMKDKSIDSIVAILSEVLFRIEHVLASFTTK